MLRCFGQAAAYAGSWVARAETFLDTDFPNSKAMEYHDFNMFVRVCLRRMYARVISAHVYERS